MNEILLIIWVGAVGAAVGSFLNVVIYRLPRGESLVFPSSHCPKCHHKIRFHDNLPIFGWFLLDGKCRDCKLPISFRYPLIETIACIIVTVIACFMMQSEMAIEKIIVQIIWFSVLHLFLLTLGMIDFDRQTLKPLYLALFLVPFLIFDAVFSFPVPVVDSLAGAILTLSIGFVVTKIILINDRSLWLFASLAVGGFLGWQIAGVVMLITLPCHVAILFVTQRSYAVLSLAAASFFANVWVIGFSRF